MSLNQIIKLFFLVFSIVLGFFSRGQAQDCDNIGFLYKDTECGVFLIDVFDEQGDYQTIELTACNLPPESFLNFSADSIGVAACTGYPLYTLTCADLDAMIWECYNEDLVDPNKDCGDVVAPVCGCDNVTYNNPCEAGAAGVSNFELGVCASSNSSLCEATFLYATLSDNLVSFTNSSTELENSIWYFCSDGSFDYGNTITHNFPGEGSYMVGMFAFGEECSSASIQIVTIGDDPVMPNCFDLEDFVFPGDTDDDGLSNMNDLLYLGLGNSQTGFPRPSATSDWYGQMALDWDSWIGDVNGKHMDCDGNGEIETSDISSILKNSTPLPELAIVSTNDAPPVYLKFDQDTILITDSGDYIVSAELMVGSGQHPIENLYGLSIGIGYPNDLVVKPIEMNYNDNSFLGSSNNLFLSAKDFKEDGQIDVGLVKNNQESVAGYGAVARLEIIIVEDIVSLRTGGVIPVDFDIKGIKLIDDSGNIISVNTEISNTIFFNKALANTKVIDNSKVTISPSPVKEQLTIDFKDLKVTSMEVFDVLGQKVYAQKKIENGESIEVSAWTTGHYILKMNTPDGIVVKKFFVQH